MDSGHFLGDSRRGEASYNTNGFPSSSDYFHGDLRRRASYTDGFTNGFSQASDSIGYSHGDLRLQALYNTNGFPQASPSGGFGFSGDRTPPTAPITNPFSNQLSRRNLTTADTDLGLCQNLNNMRISDEERRVFFTGTPPFPPVSASRTPSFLDASPLRLGSTPSFHGESSTSGYVGDGDDLHRLGLLTLQNRVLTEHMSRHNRFEPMMNQQPRLNEELDSPLNLSTLVSIFGSVYLTAKTQMGCRILQKLVEEGSFLDAMIIFREVIDHVIEIAMDPFGNYFIQKLLQFCDEQQRTQILIRFTSKPGLLVKISLNTYGTRVVQKLIETVSTKEQISLVKSALDPGFLSLVRDSNGNHVILSCLKFLGPNDNKFIFEAATRFCMEIATDRHGCCVLQRCVSHSFGAEREKLVAEIARNSLDLAQHPCGNYVVQHLIHQKLQGVSVMFELRGSYEKLSKQKFSSHVVEQCLRHYPESRSQIVHELVSVQDFEQLLQDPYANYVIQCALSVTKGCVRERLVERVKKCRNLKTNPYCKKIFSATRQLKM